MKRWMTAIMVLGFLFLGLTTVNADAGPKPELRITLINPPQEAYILDMLVAPDCDDCWVDDERFDGIDPTLIDLLEAQQSSQWVGALTHGLSYPIFGDLRGRLVDGRRVHTFTYRVPDTFKIIVVTQSGEVIISEILQRDVFLMNVRFDVSTGSIERPELWKQVAFQLGSTLIPTLIVEGVVLLMFGLWSSRNAKVMLTANVLTQLLLTFTMGLVLIRAGLLSGMVVYLLMEGIIMLIESLIYWKFFDQKRRVRRRIGYALVANFVSFFVGFVVLTETYTFLLQL